MSETEFDTDDLTIIDTSHFTDDALGDYHKYPQPKREPGLEMTDISVKSEGSEWERNRYVGRSDPRQLSYYEISIEEPLNIPVRVNQVRDPPLFPDRQWRDCHLEMNIGSVDQARKLHEALGAALEEYDRHEQREPDE